jgi:hypothetical protein
MTPPTIDDGDASIAGVTNKSVATGTNNELEDTGVDQNETNQQTNQFGIKYTSEHFTETKLLKILNDTAAAPYALYQDWRQNATNIHSVLSILGNLPK